MKWIILLGILMFSRILFAATPVPTEAEKEAWFNDDAEFRIADVNEGELNLLPNSAKASLHKSENRINILSNSTKDGWVEMMQCHRGLDIVPLAQLVFPEYIIRGLKITKQKAIEVAVVEGKSVQMENISQDAELCVAMQIKALHKELNGQYSLKNGPYQRRFLDGYYPMHLELVIDYRHANIKPVAVHPTVQPGMKVDDDKNVLMINVDFEGVLRTRVLFSKI